MPSLSSFSSQSSRSPAPSDPRTTPLSSFDRLQPSPLLWRPERVAGFEPVPTTLPLFLPCPPLAPPPRKRRRPEKTTNPSVRYSFPSNNDNDNRIRPSCLSSDDSTRKSKRFPFLFFVLPSSPPLPLLDRPPASSTISTERERADFWFRTGPDGLRDLLSREPWHRARRQGFPSSSFAAAVTSLARLLSREGHRRRHRASTEAWKVLGCRV
mmetsp:Transcript_2406/g.6647  ORF Transcript_2406/g.6647 Transcript_2406/m.6647 type:complete len:211 (-) Transcript_2406:1941-2573(-)